MNQRLAQVRQAGRFARLTNPMTASVVGALFPLPRRLVPIQRQIVAQRQLQLRSYRSR